jgi:hypothetical protein
MLMVTRHPFMWLSVTSLPFQRRKKENKSRQQDAQPRATSKPLRPYCKTMAFLFVYEMLRTK